MKKKIFSIIKDTLILFIVIMVVRFIICLFTGDAMFTSSFILVLIVFILSSIIFKIILKVYNK